MSPDLSNFQFVHIRGICEFGGGCRVCDGGSSSSSRSQNRHEQVLRWPMWHEGSLGHRSRKSLRPVGRGSKLPQKLILKNQPEKSRLQEAQTQWIPKWQNQWWTAVNSSGCNSSSYQASCFRRHQVIFCPILDPRWCVYLYWSIAVKP